MSSKIMMPKGAVKLALAILLSGVPVTAVQEQGREFALLLGASFRTEMRIDRIAAARREVDKEIEELDRMIGESERILKLAREKGHKVAESAAKEALSTNREAKRKNFELRDRLSLAYRRAKEYSAAIKSALDSRQGRGSQFRIGGLVSDHSGRVEVLKKNGEKAPLDETSLGFLEPGDVIATAGGSSAEVQTLDGRGSIQMGENSRLSLEEETEEFQALRLVEGKIFSEVDKADDFAARLQDKAAELGGQMVAPLWKKMQKLQVRCIEAAFSVRGTRFTVEIKNDGTAEMAVLEGSIEASDLKGETKVLVEQGFMVVATKDGISVPQKIVSAGPPLSSGSRPVSGQ